MPKPVLYTFLSGSYDTLKSPKVHSPGWDFVCFTDNPDIESEDWDIVRIPKADVFTSREYKILVHKFFPDRELTIYTDATFRPVANVHSFAASKTKGIWLDKHPMRSCAYEEAKVVIQKGIDDPVIVQEQINRYAQEGFPRDYGLWRCGIMVRNPKDTAELMETWWSEVSNNSFRDQISFPYSLWKTKSHPHEILPGITPGFFRQTLHALRPVSDKVHRIAFPYYLGSELNDRIEKIPADDWVLIHPKEIEPEYTLSQAHLIIPQEEVLLFPRWLHNYVRLQRHYNQEQRWDKTFEHLVTFLEGVVRKG